MARPKPEDNPLRSGRPGYDASTAASKPPKPYRSNLGILGSDKDPDPRIKDRGFFR
jgi:hypothetical protein